jgi:hypothetical protein
VIEAVKQRLPIWKKELRADGTTTWVDPSESRSPETCVIADRFERPLGSGGFRHGPLQHALPLLHA